MVLSKIGRRTRRYRNRASSLGKWLSYTSRRTRLWTYPDRMYLECTNICNLRCVMCPNGLGLLTRPKGFMDYDLFTQIIDEMAPHVRTTTLHIWGEPLLHPRIHDMIAYCRSRGLRSELSTNATLLDEETSREILGAGLGAIYLCLDGATQETYERVRRRADFDQTRANIQRFAEMKSNRGQGPQVSVQIINIKPTAAEIEQFKRLWSIPGVDRVHVKAFDSWGGQVEQINELRTDANGVVLPERRYHCPNLWYHVHIYWDGTLVCCDRDFNALNPLGNVRDGVLKAWNGSRMVELRRKHSQRSLDEVPSCSSCVEWSWWKPTPFSSHGNAPQR
jgi:radical SAM protein with 4Fe4S-binding SPASM domain